MYLTRGRVISTVDFSETGKIRTLIPELGNDIVEVTYVTPYHVPSFGGMIAIPESGSFILVARTDKTEISSAGS